MGSIYGFLGPNGAGKSTTMKMILGLIKPSKGKITVLGKEVNEKNRLSVLRNTGSLIESPSYYGHLSGTENLEIICTLKNVPPSEIQRVLKIVRMEKQKDKKCFPIFSWYEAASRSCCRPSWKSENSFFWTNPQTVLILPESRRCANLSALFPTSMA